jgi:hypothetical protein
MTTWTLSDYTPPEWEPPRKALSDEEIDVIGFNLNYPFSIRKIARAIELAHGIVQEDSEQAKETTREIPTYKGTENENS